MLVISTGCNPVEKSSSNDNLPKREVVAFEGQVDPKFVGNWAAGSGSSLNLKKDGSVEIGVSDRGGHSSKIPLAGQWLVNDGSLFLKYTVSKQPETVIKYAATLSGGALTLSSAGGRIKTVYKKKP